MKIVRLFILSVFFLIISVFKIPAQTTNESNPSCFFILTWVYLEGAALVPGGIQTFSVPMRTSLNDLHILPGQTYQHFIAGTVYSESGQPYNSAPWNYFGNEDSGYDSFGNPTPGHAGYPATVVDWVLVSLRDDPDGEPLCQKSALLHSDGHIEFVNGRIDCGDIDMDTAYYLVIEHRNHLIVMSPVPLAIVNGTITFDFRSHQSYVDDQFGFGGSGQKEIKPGVFAMYAGNGDQNITLHSDTDINFDDRTYWEGQNGDAGQYSNGDYNLNGDCNFNDRITLDYNNGKFTTVPRN